MVKMIEDEHYYNNRFIVINDIVEFERVYMVDESKFTKETYEELGEIYENLPSYLGKQTEYPCWYGDEQKGDTYFITVSFEPSGLQLWGYLPSSDFMQWERKFNELIANFPFKYQ